MAVPARVWFAVAFAVVLRPRLWWPALRQCARLAPLGWWRRPPFLPRPDHDVVAFRLATAYGTSGRARADDLLAYLQWCAHRR